METKSKWKSKAVWSAIIFGLLAMVHPVSKALGTPVIVPAWIYEVLMAFGLYSLRDGQNKQLR